MSTMSDIQTKIEEIAEADAGAFDFPMSKRTVYRRVTGLDYDDATRTEIEQIQDAYVEHFWRTMSGKVEAEKRGPDEGSEIRVPVSDAAAVTFDLESNRVTGGDSDLVQFAFDDGISTAYWILIKRDAALALGHALVGAFEGAESEGLPGFQNRAEITRANR